MNEENEFLPQDPDFRKLVKKAKRNSALRIVVISLIISIIVVIAFYFVGNSIMINKVNEEVRNDAIWHSIHGANIEEQGTSINYSLFSATSKTEFIKKVNGIPVPWVPVEKEYSIFGQSKIIISKGASGTGNVDEKRIPMYFNGERVIEFIHPKVNSSLFDDRSIVSSMDDDKVIELALSFDKGYKVTDVQKIFNKNLTWFWVDTYSESDIKNYNNFIKETGKDFTIIGDNAIGFHYINQPESKWGAEYFIRSLKELKQNSSYKDVADKIIQNITHNNKEKLSAENLEIIGVVITGTPSEIEKFNNVPFVRAASLGVTADRY
ncbi:anti sigma factor C-terminal domain-containing protein [Parageobacillus thermoglucosidasius]|uniref:anti sigma factor C-terminal domain-containing protein n=1 Tax=Parageobacillus thermoglucosidasius TaxID=1426 RepID=UPI0027FF599C|nr:anti-sigma factor [Parageobacillus thermoglucosidasius]